MRNTLICTVGISLSNNIKHLDKGNRMRKAWDQGNLKEVSLLLLEIDPGERLCGAEINSIASIYKENHIDDPYRLILLVSDTEDGRKIGDILERYYKSKKCKNIFKDILKPKVLTGLNDESVFIFQREGLKSLVTVISQYAQKYSPENIIINATGGYKAQISFAGMIGQAFEIPVYYLFEKFSKVIELPPQPISLDIRLWLNHYCIFEELETQQQLPKSNILEGLQDLSLKSMLDEEEIDGVQYISLSAMGQLFHERCRLEFAKQEIRLLALIPETEISPSQKLIKLRDDHGKDVLQAFAKKLCESPYVKSIVNSLPFNPNSISPIRRVKSDGLVEFVLNWTDCGFGLCIQTTGRTQAETNTVALHLAKKFGK